MVKCAFCGSSLTNNIKKSFSIDKKVSSYNKSDSFHPVCYNTLLKNFEDPQVFEIKITSSKKIEIFKKNIVEYKKNEMIENKIPSRYGIFDIDSLKSFLENNITCKNCFRNKMIVEEVSYSGVIKFNLKCNCGNIITYEPPKNEGKKFGRKSYKLTNDIINGSLISGLNYEKLRDFGINSNLLLPSKIYSSNIQQIFLIIFITFQLKILKFGEAKYWK
jgi:hypothetical protein